METLSKIIGRLNFCIGAIAFSAMCAVIMFQVIARYVFNNALPWPEELGRYLFLICTWASIAYCVQKKAHLRVEMLPEFVPALKNYLTFVALLANSIFFTFSCWLTWEMLQRVMRIGTKALTMPIPMWTLWVAILIFCGVSAFFACNQLLAFLRGKVRK